MDRIKPLDLSKTDEFYSERQKSVWVIRISETGGERYLYNGGVCVHAKGVILSTALFARPRSGCSKSDVEGKCPGSLEFVPLEVVQVNIERNIAMYIVNPPTQNPSSYHTSVFSEDIGTVSGQQVICILPTSFSYTDKSSSGEPYSFVEGTVTYSSGLESLANKTISMSIHNDCQAAGVENPYRTSAHLKNQWTEAREWFGPHDDDDDDDDGEYEESTGGNVEYPLEGYGGFMRDPDANHEVILSVCGADIPLIHISDLPGWSPTIFGCPVFDTTGKILGLIGFSRLQSVYAMTIAHLRNFCLEAKYHEDMEIVLNGNDFELTLHQKGKGRKRKTISK